MRPRLLAAPWCGVPALARALTVLLALAPVGLAAPGSRAVSPLDNPIGLAVGAILWALTLLSAWPRTRPHVPEAVRSLLWPDLEDDPE